MMSQEQAAAYYYRLGLKLGTHCVGDVVEWADELIAASEVPVIELIDVAVMENAHPLDVVSKLTLLTGGCGPRDVLPTVLADAHRLFIAEGSRVWSRSCPWPLLVVCRVR